MPWPQWLRPGAREMPGRPERRPVHPGAAAPAGEAGWAYLPPLQRTIAAAPRITAPHDLAAWRSPAFTGRMSHAVSPAAPAGVVDGDGLGVPASRAPAQELPLLAPGYPEPAVQRTAVAGVSPARSPATLPEARVASAPTAAPSLTVARAVDVPLPLARTVADSVAATPNAAVSQPVVTQPAVSQPVVSQPTVSQPAVTQPAVSQPVGAVAHRPHPDDAAVLGDGAAPALFAGGVVLHDNGGATEVELPRPWPAPPTPLGSRQSAPGPSRPEGGAHGSAGPAGAASGPPRRPGLGAPLPAMPVLQRLADPARALDAGPAGPGVPAGPAATVPALPESGRGIRPEPSRPVAVQSLPVQRVADSATGFAAPDAPPPATGEAAPRPAGVAVAAGEPVPSPSVIHRSVDLLGERPIPLHLAHPAAGAAPRVPGAAPTAPAAGSGPGRATAPAVQRVRMLAPEPPVFGAAASHLLSATALAAVDPFPAATASPSPGWGAARPTAPQALGPASLPTAQSASLPAAPSGAMPVQRLPGAAAAPTPQSRNHDQQMLLVATRPQQFGDHGLGAGDNRTTSVQREAPEAPGASGAGAGAGDEPAGTAQTVHPAPTASAAGGVPSSPEELDKLAARLLGPLSRRLKAEMIIDRERRGLRSDPR